MTDRLLSLRQLANKWGWSVDRVYRLVKRKEIPFVRIGRDFHFQEAAIDAWLESKTTRPVVDAPIGTARRGARRSDREWCETFDLDPEVLQ